MERKKEMQRERVGLIGWRKKMPQKERGNTTTGIEMAVTLAAATDLRGPIIADPYRLFRIQCAMMASTTDS